MMQPKPFQVEGAKWLAARKNALLADDMRLGKTLQAVEGAKLIDAKRVLVICPAMARMVWRWFFKHCGGGVKGYVLSYEDARKYPWNQGWLFFDLLVVDESHFTKTPEAKRTLAVWGKPSKERPRGGAAWISKRVWCLSGTPAPNHVGELWPMLRAFGAVKMSYWDYVRHFCHVDAMNKIRGTKMDKLPDLRRILAPIALRRMKHELGLKEPMIEPLPVKPDPTYLRLADPLHGDEKQRLANEQMQRLGEELKGKTPDQVVEYLAEHVEHYASVRRINAVLKAPALAELIQFEIENGLTGKLVVFGYSRDALRLLSRELRFADIKNVLVYGGTPQRKKEQAVKSFHNPRGAQVFLGNIISAGTAIDLSVASEAIMLEMDWVPGNNAQAMDRMGGWNQRNDMRVRTAFIEGSVDEIITRVYERKLHELSEVFDK